MLKSKNDAIFINSQDVFWSKKRLVTILSQIIMLVIVVVILLNTLITLGERQLQQEWATDRYRELQTVSSLLADKFDFQRFRTQTFANSNNIHHYLDAPSTDKYNSLINNWQKLQRRTPELLGIVLYDAQGKMIAASNSKFENLIAPSTLLNRAKNLETNEIYTSPLSFLSLIHRENPYFYQVAKLKNEDLTVKGYVVTYNSITSIIQSINPSFSSTASPLLLLSDRGILFAGASDLNKKSQLPYKLGSNIKALYPQLWSVFNKNKFGQYNGPLSTVLYLKLSLSSMEDKKYVLASYINNNLIKDKFTPWRNHLYIAAILSILLISSLIILIHTVLLEKKARYNSIYLAQGFFNSVFGYIFAERQGNIIRINASAAQLLQLQPEHLNGNNLQRLLQQNDADYAAIQEEVATNTQWKGNIEINSLENGFFKVFIRQFSVRNSSYLLVSLRNISELKITKEDAKLANLLSDSTTASALIIPKGTIIKFNDAFNMLLPAKEKLNKNIFDFLDDDLHQQWDRIKNVVAINGQWQGKILHPQDDGSNIQMTIKGIVDNNHELAYFACIFEPIIPYRNFNNELTVTPSKSTILLNKEALESYFDALDKSDKELSNLIVLDVSYDDILNHISNFDQLENTLHEIKMHLLREIPCQYQMAHWQLGKLVIVLPFTNSNQAHDFAIDILSKLAESGLGKGICIGIASYQEKQNLDAFLANAETALKRAKQMGTSQRICQAYTQDLKSIAQKDDIPKDYS